MKDLEFNKLAAAILLAGLIAMVSGTIAKIYYRGNEHHREEKRGFSVDVGEAVASDAAPVEIDILGMIANGDATKGSNIAKKCMTCHSFEKGGANKVGPNLWGVLGGKKAHAAGFQYSKVIAEMGGNWDYESLWKFVNAPAKYAAGTKMAFAGIKKPEELADLIAYINSMSDSPLAKPEAKK